VVLRALEIIRLAHMREKISRILIGVDNIHTDDGSDTPTATGDESDDYFSIDSPSWVMWSVKKVWHWPTDLKGMALTYRV
jgi:hypothetical protein